MPDRARGGASVNSETGCLTDVDTARTARARIDAFVEQVKTNAAGGYFEIEGHADATGPEGVNDRLGLQRAEAVKRYLYETHALPLHTISVISYGESQPVAPNTTREGRAQNRRVVIKVLG